MTFISSRDNPRVRRWRELTRDARARRKQHRAMIEGENLISAFLQSGGKVESLMLSKTASGRPELMALAKLGGKSSTVLADAVFRSIVDAEAPAGIAAEIAIPLGAQDLKTANACLLLDAVQDSGNVGTILRSATAFGIRHAVLGKGCADAWSPKVLRAAAGAHFSLQITEDAELVGKIREFSGKIVCTVPRGGVLLSNADLSGRIGWIFGAEGRGVSEALAACASLKISIPMQGGTESLNVAAAAAICFYERSRRAGP
ncbi:MAG: RNA methyltransferase [Betaproteobacteria bacterium]|nr:RNA methyltransferase [Betaproteobacteria bacterium]